RAHNPIRVRSRHCDIEWAHEATADQVPCRQRRAGQRYALAIDCRIDRHTGVIDHGTARRVHAGHADKVEPLAPTLPIADVEEREAAEIRGRAEPVAAVEQLRTADWKEFFRTEASDVQSGLGSVAVPDSKVEVLAREVDVMRGCANPQIDLGMN